MAQEAQGNVSYSQNPSGIGAVYFSNPVDLLGAQRAQGKDLQETLQIREQAKNQKKKLAYDLIGDINVDTKGILDNDVTDIQKGVANLQKMYADVLRSGIDPENPAFVEAYSALQGEKQKLQANVERSKMDKDLTIEFVKKYDPSKHEDVSLQNIDAYKRTPLAERSQYDIGKVLVSKKEDFGKLADVFMKEEKPKVTSKDIKTEQGRVAIQTIKENDFDGMASAFLASPDRYDSAKLSFDKLGETDPILYQSIIDRAGKTGDPVKLFTKDYFQNRSPKSEELSNADYTPQERAYWSAWGANKKDEQGVKYYVERIDALSKDNTLWKDAESLESLDLPSLGITTPQAKAYTSGVLAGTQLGQTTIPIYEVVRDGADYVNQLKGYETIPNQHLYFVKFGNKMFAVTTASKILHEQNAAPLLVPVDENYLDQLTAGASNPIKAKEELRKSLIEKGLYKDGQILINQQPTTQITQAVNKPTAQPKETFEQYIGRFESKVGRKATPKEIEYYKAKFNSK